MSVVSMSKQEFSRLEVLLRVQSGRLRVADACAPIGASLVGAMFQVGSRFGSGPVVPNRRASASAGRKLAYRPHIRGMW